MQLFRRFWLRAILLLSAIMLVSELYSLGFMSSSSSASNTISKSHIKKELDIEKALSDGDGVHVGQPLHGDNLASETLNAGATTPAADSFHTTAPVKSSEDTSVPARVAQLRQWVQEQNAAQQILNADRFGPVADNSLVVVVQVHNRLADFQVFLEALRNVRGREKVLLIISMDYVSDEMEQLVRSVNFCKVLPIYFPQSVQLHPNEFPGTNPRDCEPFMSAEAAQAAGCLNKDHPDKYHHYRDAKITAPKHHWWWKCVYVFEHISVLQDHTGYVLLLEEDHMLAPDTFYLLEKMEKLVKSKFLSIDFLNIGQQRLVTKHGFGAISNGPLNRVHSTGWMSSKHNMGFALTRSVWEQIKSCTQMFCNYDDYNWDWTLQYIGTNCRQRPWQVLTVAAPRVYHFGMCGVHFHRNKESCNPQKATSEYRQFLQDNREALFPSSLVYESQPRKQPQSQPNGGWGDPRDRNLCLETLRRYDRRH